MFTNKKKYTAKLSAGVMVAQYTGPFLFAVSVLSELLQSSSVFHLRIGFLFLGQFWAAQELF